MQWTTMRCAANGRALLALGCVALASCGGGGGDNPTSAAPTASAAASAPVAGASSAASTCNLPNFQTSLLARINQLRATGANCGSEGTFGVAAPLTWNARLTASADAHS